VSTKNSREAATPFLAMAATLASGIAGLVNLGAPTVLAAKAMSSPTPTIADHTGSCPSYKVDQTSFERLGLNEDQRSFIMHAVHQAQPQDRGQLYWAVLGGRALVFTHVEGWTPNVVLAYEPSVPFDKSYRDKDAGHLLYTINQGPGATCSVFAANPIGH
jgi:hypothetical protein